MTGISANVRGTSLLGLATPALLNRMTSLPCARPSVTAGSQLFISENMEVEDQRKALLPAKAPVGESYALGFDELCRGCLVRVIARIGVSRSRSVFGLRECRVCERRPRP